MRLNNRGVSLIELIISVGLISVVIVFIYNLIADVNTKMTNPDFAIQNQVNRFEIIKAVQNDALQNPISSIIKSSGRIVIYFKDGKTSTLAYTYANMFDGDIITYTNRNGLPTKWILDKGCYVTRTYSQISVVGSSSSIGFTIKIPIYTTSALNDSGDNNPLDDLIFIFANDLN